MEQYTRKIIIYFAKVIISVFMFRLFYLLIFLFFYAGPVLSQDMVNLTNKKGHKEGFWKKSDSLGNKIYEGWFKDGLPDGEFRYFYPDGKIKTISVYSDHGKRAKTISNFPNGMKMATGNYLNEKKDSIWQFFSQNDGTLVSEEEYRDGIRNGISRIFFLQGGVAQILTWKDGVREGPWEEYYSDGKVKAIGTYRNNEKEGAFRAFYLSGKPILVGQYLQGHPDGTWIYYEEDGTISKQETWEKGTLVIPEE